jgi:excinuclease UvrABC ATPase subunit
MKQIEIKGARVHNLKGMDISIPKNKLIVATGFIGYKTRFAVLFKRGDDLRWKKDSLPHVA